MTRLAQDLRYAMRVFVRARSVTILGVLAFALGIGVTSAVFSLFNSVLLTPLPYPEPEQLVVVYDTQPACPNCPASFPKYQDWKARNQVFAAIGGSRPANFVLTGRGEPEQLGAMATTASLIDVLRVRPAAGRWYTEDEDRPGAGKVIVLSHGFWTRRLGSNPNAIGERLVLDGEPYEIVGVMPEGFSHRNAHAFVPLAMKLDPGTRGTHFLTTYARLKPGVTVERATAEMRALGQSLARELGHNHGIDVRSYYEVIVGNIRTPLRVLLGAVFLVLLIACANVANLLLAAGLARRRELAIRLALGAGHRDLARQLITEAILLALAGGTAGVLLASWAVRSFVLLAGDVLPRATSVQVDGRVLLFTAVVSLTVGIVCGLWPLTRLHTRQLATAVREGDTRAGTGTGGRFGNGLVVAEIAVAFALLVGASLLVKNLVLLQRRDAGVQTARVVAFDVAPAGPRYRAPDATRTFYRDLLARLRGIGGVEAVGVISHLPMYRFGTNGEATIEGGNPWSAASNPLIEWRWAGGEYFNVMGIRLLRGRLFDDRDKEGSPPVVVISKAMADKFWPGQDPVGKRIAPGSTRNWSQVIGVVSDVRSFGLASNTPFEMYRSIEQQPFSAATVVVRTTSDDPTSIVAAARQVVQSIDPALPVTEVQTMEQVVAASVSQPRLLSALSGVFGALAGLLAMVGVYGVTAYNVRRQRREFGIRLALGADPRAVQKLVVFRGLVVAAAGIAIGAAGAVLLTRSLQSMLNDVQPTDPVVFGANAAAILLVSVLACYLPARAAARVDPVVVLRD
jgi:predicted permease